MTKSHYASESFNSVGATPRKIVVLLIDLPLSSYYEMKSDDQKAYLDTMSETISTLRMNDIDIVWFTMKDKNSLYAPQVGTGGNDAYTMGEMQKMGLIGFGEETKPDALKNSRQIVHERQSMEFLQQSGPRKNETVFSKFFMSGFISPDEYKDNPERYVELREQFRKDIEVTLPVEGDSLHNHLKNDLHATDLVLMGAFADHCVAENALDAHLHGYNVTVVSDRVVGWDENNDRLMVWNNKNYENTVRDTIAHRVKERNLDADVSGILYTTFPSFSANLSSTLEQSSTPKTLLKNAL